MSGLSLRARVGLGWQVPAPDLGSGPEGDPGISLIPMTDKRGVCGLAWVPKFNYPHTSIKLPPKRLIIVKRGKKMFSIHKLETWPSPPVPSSLPLSKGTLDRNSLTLT